MTVFRAWAITFSERGVETAYRTPVDYLPGNLYLLTAVGGAYRSLVNPAPPATEVFGSPLLAWLIKVPPILFHIATAALVFALARQRQGARWAIVSAVLLLFNPAALFAVAYWGTYDPVYSLFCLLSVAALAADRPMGAGAAIALAALTKPQSWVLVPLVVGATMRRRGLAGLPQLALSAGAVLLLVLAPFIADGRVRQLARLPSYMENAAPDNAVISASAHNVWWIPTVANRAWIPDAQVLAGPLSYRLVGVTLVVLVLVAYLARLRQPKALPDPYLLAAGLAASWFFVTPRAHENHLFFVLPLLAVAWPGRPRVFALNGLASIAILSNLVLEDPRILGGLVAVGGQGPGEASAAPYLLQALPAGSAPESLAMALIALTLVNVALYALLAGGLAAALGMAWLPSRRPRQLQRRAPLVADLP